MSPATQIAAKTALMLPSPKLLRFPEFDAMLQRVHESFDRIAKRAFELFEEGGRVDGHHLEDWLRAESELFRPLSVEIEDTGKQLILRADVPGFQENELDVGVDTNQVVITGRSEHKKEEKGKGNLVRSERQANEICRCLSLPDEVDPEQATAMLKHGKLEIKLNKRETTSTGKKIPVKAA